MVLTNVLNDLNPVFSTSLTSVQALASQHLSRFSGITHKTWGLSKNLG